MKSASLNRLLAYSLLLTISPVAMAEKPPKQRFGVACIDGKVGYVALNDPVVHPGETLLLVRVSSGDSPKVVTAEIGKRLSSCKTLEKADLKGPYYSIRLPDSIPDDFDVAIAVRESGSLKVKQGKYVSLVSSNGSTLSFRHCASSEGLHLTVWSGLPTKGKRIWHEYYYLGYDTEPDCNESDY